MRITYSLADQNFATTKSVGILNVSIGLVEHLAARPGIDRLTVLGNGTLTSLLRLPPSVELQCHDQAIAGRLRRLLWDQSGVYGAAKQAGNEWLILPKGFASFCRSCPVRLAAFVHDTMFDHYERRYPHALSRAEQVYFRRCFRATMRQAEVVFTNSVFTAEEIRRVASEHGWPVPALHPVGVGFTPRTPPVQEKPNRIVVLGGRYPHKQSERAADYLARWHRQSDFSGTVEWVGGLPDGLELPPLPGWKKHPRLPDADYQALLDRSRVIVYFSDYEGFGMPPIEAVLAGASPVFSRLPSTIETVGDCGFSFDNDRFEEFAGAMSRAVTTGEEQIAAWREQLTARHDWNAVVERVLAALRGAAPAIPAAAWGRSDLERRGS